MNYPIDNARKEMEQKLGVELPMDRFDMFEYHDLDLVTIELLTIDDLKKQPVGTSCGSRENEALSHPDVISFLETYTDGRFIAAVCRPDQFDIPEGKKEVSAVMIYLKGPLHLFSELVEKAGGSLDHGLGEDEAMTCQDDWFLLDSE